MEKYNINGVSLLKNEKAIFPMMGEFHFSRCPETEWEDEIRKMKACGMDIIATYVFWLHHEEAEGVFDLSGQRNLHRFLELCDKWQMHVWLRIGPWAHGEARNGGFPDWLLKKGYKLRSDDMDYLALVERFWKKIYKEVEGTHCILGIQIENEYGHVGGLRGAAGEQHMRTLTKLAKTIGFEAPYWTATGWGGAVLGDLTPVMGGYCDAPWDASLKQLPPNKNYLFSTVRNDGNIGSDYAPGMELSFDKDAYPYLTAELGGGLQVTHRRRPRVTAEDIGSMSVCKLGSGCNLLGYYMYHGGTNPKGKFSTLQESTEVGSFCDVPELSYDFQAPIREYGQISETAKELKLLSMFVHDYGETFCNMEPQFAGEDCEIVQKAESKKQLGNEAEQKTKSCEKCVNETADHEKNNEFVADTVLVHSGNFQDAEDLSAFRMITRRNGDRGYLFVNNYQRGYEMAEHRDVTLRVQTADGEISFPKQDIKNGDYFFYPFNFPLLDDVILRWINQTPLCNINQKLWFFYGNEKMQYDVDRELSGQALIRMEHAWAKNAWRMKKYPNILFFSEAPILETENGIEVIYRSDRAQKKCWMIMDATVENVDQWIANGWKKSDIIPEFLHVEGDASTMCVLSHDLTAADDQIVVSFTNIDADTEITSEEKNISHRAVKTEGAESETCEIGDTDKNFQEYAIQISYDKAYDAAKENIFLEIGFQADQAELYLNGEKIADQYYIGDIWEVGLKRFDFPAELTLRLYPLKEDAPIYLETHPRYTNGVCCTLRDIHCVCEQKENL